MTHAPPARLRAARRVVFKIEGMDCHEEVAILERRLKRLAGPRGAGRRRRRPAAQDQVRRGEADDGRGSPKRWRRPACARGWSTRSRGRLPPQRWRDRLVIRLGRCARGRADSRSSPAAAVPAWRGFPFSPPSSSAASTPPAAPGPRSRRASLDINVLMMVAVAGAIALGEWSEGASVVFLFALAQVLEARAMERARGAIRALMDLAPAEALVVRDRGIRAVCRSTTCGVGDRRDRAAGREGPARRAGGGRPESRQPGAGDRRVAAGREDAPATTCSPARSTGAARSKSR